MLPGDERAASLGRELTDPVRERREAARRQTEIDRLAALDPTLSAQIAPQEVEDSLNRKPHK